MTGGGGFYSVEQEENFAAARALTQRGESDAAFCGARNRRGGQCQAVPIKGSCRCIRHCGPKAARKHRERQLQAFLAGRVSAEAWRRAEANRAANRLREAWKKDPWMPGRTIDLGEQECAFQDALRADGAGLEGLPPAVADWLRWKFRRQQVDRRDCTRWQFTLHEDLPKRLRAAGPCPPDRAPDPDQMRGVVLPGVVLSAQHCETPDHGSKRRLADGPRAPKMIRPRKQFGPGRPRTRVPDEDEGAALAMTCAQHHAMLTPLLENCGSQSQRDSVVQTLHEYLKDPGSAVRMERWVKIVAKLRS